MAVLSEGERATLHHRIMQRISTLGQSTGATKPEWRQLVDAADDWVDTNAGAYNTAIPAGIRGKFTTTQKALALALVCFRRAGEG